MNMALSSSLCSRSRSRSLSLPAMNSIRSPTTFRAANFCSIFNNDLASINISRRLAHSLCSVRPTTFTSRRLMIPLAIRVKGEAQEGPIDKERTAGSASHFIDVMWRFARPHTIRGTIFGSLALAGRVWMQNPHMMSWGIMSKELLGLLALICGNAFVVGVNQIFDVEIDKVNKPYLPMASGELSAETAWMLMLFYLATALAIVFGTKPDPLLPSLYCLGLVLATTYSVPPFRLRRFPLAAASIIASVRGFMFNFGTYYGIRTAFGLGFEWSPAFSFVTSFVTLLALIIALLKDLSDVEGDLKNNIRTFSTKLGVRNIAILGTGLFLVNYVGAVLLAAYMPQFFRASFMIPVHIILALSLIFKAWELEQTDYSKEATQKFYHFIWILFYAEYIIFPFI